MCDQCVQILRTRPRCSTTETLLQTRNRDLQTFISVGLQHIIDCAGVKRFDGVLIECGDKHHMAFQFTIGGETFGHFNAGHLRHLDVEKRETRLMFGDRFQCRFTIADVSQDF